MRTAGRAWQQNLAITQTWPWWLGVMLLCTAPFLSSWRVGPLSGMYLESGALLFAVLLALLTALGRHTATPPPRATVYWLLLALLLVMQARLQSLPYVSQSDLSAAVLLGLALLSWAARVWVKRLGQDAAVTVVTWALLAGALLQSLVCVLQFAGETHWLPGLLPGPGKHQIFGQLAQRNHLGHYLMWGVLALCYLWQSRRLPGWLGFSLLLWLSSMMGLIGSRTLIAYVLVLAPALLLWWWRGGNAARRAVFITAAALLLVGMAQLWVSPALSSLELAEFRSGAGRLGDGAFAQSGRYFEWHKAWRIFLDSPWWGHGWGSYAYQGFADTGVYANGFRPYETSVLFTHSHNLLLQLLAETGLVGTVMVVGGFVWAAWGLWRKPFSAASMLLSLMLLVSLTHSMLEYPLWYVYFLAVFALLLALTPVVDVPMETADKPRRWRWAVAAVCALMLAYIVRAGFAYQILLIAGRPSHSIQNTETQLADLRWLRQREYWLRYYVDMTLIQKINTAQAPLPDWGRDAADLAGRYRPYSNTYIRGIYLAQHGQGSEGADWLQRMARYYPDLMPHFLATARQQPGAEQALAALQAACEEHARRHTDRPAICPPAPPLPH